MSASRRDGKVANHEDPQDAAARWLLAQDQGHDVAADPGFRSWLAASSENGAAWRAAQAMWEAFEDAEDPFLEAMREDALRARPRPRIGPVVAAACVAAAAVLGGGLFVWRSAPRTPGAALIAADARPDFTTEKGAVATYALADGSQITLDTGSAVAVRYAGGRRVARLLAGQAYFKVKHDPAHPFVVEAGEHAMTDLGTEFDVRLNPAGVSVVLASGSVAVRKAASRADAVVLKPGQRLDATATSGYRISTVDLTRALAWRTGYLEFDDEALSAALVEMNRYAAAPAVIKDRRIGDLRVSGRFRTGDTARFADTLSEIYPLRAQRRADGGVDIFAR